MPGDELKLDKMREKLSSWEAKFIKLNGHKPTLEEMKKLYPDIYKYQQKYLKLLEKDPAKPKESTPKKKNEEIIEPSPAKPTSCTLFNKSGVFSKTLNKSLLKTSLDSQENTISDDEKENNGIKAERLFKKLTFNSASLVREPVLNISKLDESTEDQDESILATLAEFKPKPVKTVEHSTNFSVLSKPKKAGFRLDSFREFLDEQDIEQIKKLEEQVEVESEAPIEPEPKKKEPRKLKKPKTTKVKKSAGNFVAMKLTRKPKKQFGKRKRFQSNKPDYSYSMGSNHAPLEEMGLNVELDAELVQEKQKSKKQKQIDPCEFIFNESKDELTEISRHFGFESNLHVDLEKALKVFAGLESFRKGQREAIVDLLAFKSTLLVIGTGSGKSLCYQLTSFILQKAAQFSNIPNKLTIAILPTISLMNDQVKNMPPLLESVCWNSNSNHSEVKEKLSTSDILFVSPEKFQSSHFLEFLKDFSLWFICVDEAHCVDEWSHGFRPCYLQLGQTISKMNLKVYACTATATATTRDRICKQLSIENIHVFTCIRPNITLNVTKVPDYAEREKMLVNLLQSTEYKDKSVIVYTMFQNQAEKLASVLRIHNITSESYHAGKDPVERNVTQSRFMNNRIRVVVATVSFGLGLNKSDIGAIVHCGLPRSVEEYVQEVGRCARDSSIEGSCHLLLCKEDYKILNSLCYSDGIDLILLKKLLNSVFELAGVLKDNYKHVHIPYSTLESQYDMKNAIADTLFIYLSEECSDIRVMPSCFAEFKLKFIKTDYNELAKTNELVQAISEMGAIQSAHHCTLDAFEFFKKTGMNPFQLEQKLFELKKQREILYEGSQKSVFLKINQNLDSWSKFDLFCEKVMNRMDQLECAQVRKLDSLYKILVNNTDLATSFNEYFDQSQGSVYKLKFADDELDQQSKTLRQSATIDVKLFVKEHMEQLKSPRAVARIFHGLSSPAHPYQMWSSFKQWSQYKNIYFKDLEKAAQQAFKAFKK